MRHKLLLAGLMALAATGMVMSSSPKASAQAIPGKRTAIQTPDAQRIDVMRVRGGGEKTTPQAEASQLQRSRVVPAPLTQVQKERIAGQPLLGQTFVLSPSVPSLQGKGYLRFFNSQFILTGSSSFRGLSFPSVAAFASQTSYAGSVHGVAPDDRLLQVVIQPDAVHRFYMVDCAVDDGDRYFVRVLPGSDEQTFDNTNHLVVIYDSEPVRDPTFEVNITGSARSSWTFYSCEVTPFNTR